MTTKHRHYLEMTANAVHIIHHLHSIASDKENVQLIALGVVWLWEESTVSTIVSKADAFKKEVDKQYMLAKIGQPSLQDFADKVKDGYTSKMQTVDANGTLTEQVSLHSFSTAQSPAQRVPAAILKRVFANQAPPFALNEDGSVEFSVYQTWLSKAGQEAIEALNVCSAIVSPTIANDLNKVDCFKSIF